MNSNNPFVVHKNSVPFLVYSYLTGAVLYHKIARLSKSTRNSIIDAKLLD